MNIQIVVNALITASCLSLVAVGFGVTFQTLKFFHFAHASVLTAATYTLYSCVVLWSWNWIPGVCVALLAALALGVAFELGIYRQLRRRGASKLVMLIASLGLLIVVQNTIAALFGDVPRVIPLLRSAPTFDLLGGRVTTLQLALLAVNLIVGGTVAAWWKWTRIGRALRAVADDPELATLYGIPFNIVALVAISVGSVVGAIGGIFLGLDSSISPNASFQAFLLAVVIVLIAGGNSMFSVVACSVLVASVEHFVGWAFSTAWQNAIVFVFLFVSLWLRPHGIFGQSRRIG